MKPTLLALTRVALLVVFAGVSWVAAGHSVARAADPHAHAVGDEKDNFWNIGETSCTHWITIVAQQIRHEDGSISDGLPYSLQLVSVKSGGVDVPLLMTLPRRIAGATGPPLTLRHGMLTVFFRQPVSSGTSLTIEIDRIDHGDSTVAEDSGDNSNGDDVFILNDTASTICSMPSPS
jgi:hypothetical protein